MSLVARFTRLASAFVHQPRLVNTLGKLHKDETLYLHLDVHLRRFGKEPAVCHSSWSWSLI